MSGTSGSVQGKRQGYAIPEFPLGPIPVNLLKRSSFHFRVATFGSHPCA